jgi:hypothetical protein
MRRIVLLACVFIAMFAVEVASAEQKAESSLSVRIVPDRIDANETRTIDLSLPKQHFYVVVTNISDKQLRLWREWSSWGYYNLSFVIKDDDGKTTVVKKGRQAWTRNFPDWTMIPPGDHLVFEVSFLSETWPTAPVPVQGKSRTVKMTAVFEIPEDKETKEYQVWTGKVYSPEHTYVIHR